MFIILGGTGHVGSAAARALLDQRRPVTIVTRSAAKAEGWQRRGAEAAVVDVRDVDRLRAVFRRGRRAFLLNPPADVATDTDAGERETVRCILAALDGSGLEKVVAESAYGAQPGERCGDLTVLHGLEQGLKAQAIPATIQRAGYYMSNWAASLEAVRGQGMLPSMLPVGLRIPMVAPEDLGRAAARWLTEPVERTGLHYVEGPEPYSAADVAAAFAEALGRPIAVNEVPREAWEETFRSLGFSEPAAESYARMTAASVDGGFEMPDRPVRGSVTLRDYIGALVRRERASKE
jgi:uncharacterized protein YbjT (DUF2867 family)